MSQNLPARPLCCRLSLLLSAPGTHWFPRFTSCWEDPQASRGLDSSPGDNSKCNLLHDPGVPQALGFDSHELVPQDLSTFGELPFGPYTLNPQAPAAGPGGSDSPLPHPTPPPQPPVQSHPLQLRCAGPCEPYLVLPRSLLHWGWAPAPSGHPRPGAGLSPTCPSSPEAQPLQSP